MLLNLIKYLPIFILVVGISVSKHSCNENDALGINLTPLRDYIIAPAHEDLQVFIDKTAVQTVSEIKLGWNLGNTFDAHDNNAGWLRNATVSAMETAWGNPVTTRENIKALYDAGFNTFRLPVTWFKVLDENLIIREDWMARVTEVINYAEEFGMYIIINTHHDESIFKFTDDRIAESLIVFDRIWRQIAFQFRNYNEKLIFEALNEPRTKGASHEWNGGAAEEHRNINKYYEVFINAVRTNGGNNDKRILMVSTYAASAEQRAMDGLVIPADTIANKIVVSIHTYTPYNFALNTNKTFNTWDENNPSDTRPIVDIMDRAYNMFVSKGIPVILGEFGAMNKNNNDVRANWARFYVKTAMDRGMPCIWWDNGLVTGNGELFGLLNRRTNQWDFIGIVNAMKQGAGLE